MKATWTIKPLAFAIAAGLAFSAQAQEVPDGANASVTDIQTSGNNAVLNQDTQNTGRLTGSGDGPNESNGALNGATGNIGINVAGGDHNQQANAAALATADAGFLFGATANIGLTQNQLESAPNTVWNYSTNNTAEVLSSANNTSGNVGINVAAGVFNQQKNDLAVAVGSGFNTNATNNTSQTSTGNTTFNYADATVQTGSLTVDLALNATGTTAGNSTQANSVYPEIWVPGNHPDGQTQIGHIDIDPETQGGALRFTEEGTITLAGTVSGSAPVLTVFDGHVINNAIVSGSLNGASGNVGLNVAAGGGNQQANSLAIAAGCAACSGSTPTPTPTSGR